MHAEHRTLWFAATYKEKVPEGTSSQSFAQKKMAFCESLLAKHFAIKLTCSKKVPEGASGQSNSPLDLSSSDSILVLSPPKSKEKRKGDSDKGNAHRKNSLKGSVSIKGNTNRKFLDVTSRQSNQ